MNRKIPFAGKVAIGCALGWALGCSWITSHQPAIVQLETASCTAIDSFDPSLGPICLGVQGIEVATAALLAVPSGQPADLPIASPDGTKKSLHLKPEQVDKMLTQLDTARRAAIAAGMPR